MQFEGKEIIAMRIKCQNLESKSIIRDKVSEYDTKILKKDIKSKHAKNVRNVCFRKDRRQ